MKISTFTKMQLVADHRLILLRFCQFATEDCVACRFQRFVLIDLGKDDDDDDVIYIGQGYKYALRD